MDVKKLFEAKLDRRKLLGNLGMMGAGAALTACGGVIAQPGTDPEELDKAILNFALNLEYLEAEFYLAAVGRAPAYEGDVTGTVTGGSAVDFSGSPALEDYANEIADDEEAHVLFLRSALGADAVDRPDIDIAGGASGAFGVAAKAAGANAGLDADTQAALETFSPYANPLFFLHGAFLFEDVGVTAYAGTPDYLKVILEKADEMGVTLGIVKAAVSGGALFPSLREWYADRGISCLQCYATADVGHIAYETPAMEGMIIDEGVIVEIVTPGTGDPVAEGEVGEVLVTSLNPDYPLVRFATGDLSAMMPGQSPCGRTNTRIKGWMGRADQTTKIKGMFVRPEQVAALVAKHAEIDRARIVASRDGEMDVMTVRIETKAQDSSAFEPTIVETLKLKGKVELVPPGALPRDGLVIEDARSYD